MKNFLATAAEWADRLLRTLRRYQPQRYSDLQPRHVAGELYDGRHRRDIHQAAYHKAGAIHWGNWYDEPTGPWALIK